MTRHLTSYFIFTFLLVLTPGTTTAVVISNTLERGRAAGFQAAAGAAFGSASHALGAALGLALLVARWPAGLGALRMAGGAYLAWLGLVNLWGALRTSRGALFDRHAPAAGARTPEGTSFTRPWGAVRQGLVTNLLNPSIATFYLAVVPSYVPSGAPRWYFAALALVHVTMAFGCHALWVLAFDRIGRLFARPHARRLVAATLGLTLLGLAWRVVRPPT